MNQIEDYLATLNSKERIALSIAKEQLGSSFCLEKSLGYLAWLEKNQTSIYDESKKNVTSKKKRRIRIKKKSNIKIKITSDSTSGERGGGDAAANSR